MRRLIAWPALLAVALSIPAAAGAVTVHDALGLRGAPGSRSAGIPVYRSAPRMVEAVRGTRVYVPYARPVGYDFYRYDDRYYVCQGGDWYASVGYQGPFMYVDGRYVPVPVSRLRYGRRRSDGWRNDGWGNDGWRSDGWRADGWRDDGRRDRDPRQNDGWRQGDPRWHDRDVRWTNGRRDRPPAIDDRHDGRDGRGDDRNRGGWGDGGRGRGDDQGRGPDQGRGDDRGHGRGRGHGQGRGQGHGQGEGRGRGSD